VRIALVIAVLAAALAAALTFTLSREDGGAAFRGSEAPAGLGMPQFAVAAADGSIDSQALRGKAVAVTFLDTQCTEACPIVAAQMAQAVRALGDERRRVVALAFSVDPVNDTRARIKSFLERHRALGEIRYVDASVAQLRPVWDDFDVLASHDTGESNRHSAPVRVYDAEGRWRSTLHPGVDLSGANLAHDLRLALDSS